MSSVVRVEAVYADGSRGVAEGAHAEKVWKWFNDCQVFCAIHGMTFVGEPMHVIPSGEPSPLEADRDSWKLRAEIAQGALKPEQQERDKQEYMADDVLEFVKRMSQLPDFPEALYGGNARLLNGMRDRARELLDRRAKLYDKEHKPA